MIQFWLLPVTVDSSVRLLACYVLPHTVTVALLPVLPCHAPPFARVVVTPPRLWLPFFTTRGYLRFAFLHGSRFTLPFGSVAVLLRCTFVCLLRCTRAVRTLHAHVCCGCGLPCRTTYACGWLVAGYGCLRLTLHCGYRTFTFCRLRFTRVRSAYGWFVYRTYTFVWLPAFCCGCTFGYRHTRLPVWLYAFYRSGFLVTGLRYVAILRFCHAL